MKKNIILTCFWVCFLAVSAFSQEELDRCGFWLDLYKGEPITFSHMMEDLSTVDVIYLGETHRLARHHRLQGQILDALHDQGKKILLGLEQIEHPAQPTVDLYNQGQIDLVELANRIEWGKQWKNYEDYRPLVESVRSRGGKVVALNAPAEIIRKVGREGLASLSPEERESLPANMQLDDPLYEQWMNQLLLVHMPLSKETLQPVFHAQVSRDETMAYQMAEARKTLEDSENWISVILCGQGHCAYGLGIPARLQRLMPESRDRVVLMTESGDTVLTEKEKAMARDIEITHEALRFLQKPIGDYLHAYDLNPNEEDLMTK